MTMTFRTWRWPVVARVLLAGPAAIIISLLVVAGMPLWFPKGAAGIDHIALPIILMPTIWAVLFFHALLDRSLARVAVTALGLASLSVAMVIWQFSTPA